MGEVKEGENEVILQPWTKLYKAALLEFESEKLIERIDRAEIAISDRLHDLRFDCPSRRATANTGCPKCARVFASLLISLNPPSYQ